MCETLPALGLYELEFTPDNPICHDEARSKMRGRGRQGLYNSSSQSSSHSSAHSFLTNRY